MLPVLIIEMICIIEPKTSLMIVKNSDRLRDSFLNRRTSGRVCGESSQSPGKATRSNGVVMPWNMDAK
jgi:hypothetical protein